MFGSKLIFDQEFTEANDVTENLDKYYFKSCKFSKLKMEGGDFGTVMVFCMVSDCDLYWVSAISGLFVNTRFVGTAFRGVSFAGSIFVECSFLDCSFTKDNLGGDCDFGDAKFFDCEFQDTPGAPSAV